MFYPNVVLLANILIIVILTNCLNFMSLKLNFFYILTTSTITSLITTVSIIPLSTSTTTTITNTIPSSLVITLTIIVDLYFRNNLL